MFPTHSAPPPPPSLRKGKGQEKGECKREEKQGAGGEDKGEEKEKELKGMRRKREEK